MLIEYQKEGGETAKMTCTVSSVGLYHRCMGPSGDADAVLVVQRIAVAVYLELDFLAGVEEGNLFAEVAFDSRQE